MSSNDFFTVTSKASSRAVIVHMLLVKYCKKKGLVESLLVHSIFGRLELV
jgi:hypothetical protein